MSPLAKRCEFTIDYRSKGFVEDAMLYARWILKLRDADATTRAEMLRDLDGASDEGETSK